MMRLALILYAMVGITFAGSAVVLALVLGLDTLWPIIIAAALGAVVAIPATIAIARQLTDSR